MFRLRQNMAAFSEYPIVAQNEHEISNRETMKPTDWEQEIRPPSIRINAETIKIENSLWTSTFHCFHEVREIAA